MANANSNQGEKICSVTLGVTITAPISTTILVHAIAIIPAVADHAAATLGAADAAAAVATTHGATSVAMAAAATTDAAILTMAAAAAINADSAANGCGWYTCPCGSNNFFWLPSTVSNQVPPTTRTINIGYFTNPSATSIATDGIIPLTLSRQIGSQITSSGTGALLPTGVYDVSYSLSGTPTAAPDPAPGTAAVGVKLNGNTVPIFTQSASTTSTANPYNISSHGILEVTSPSSILTLNNLGEEAQNFTDVNLVIRKLA